MKSYRSVRFFLLGLMITSSALATLPAFAFVGSYASNVQFVFYGAAPPSAGGPSSNMCMDVQNGQVFQGALVGPWYCNNMVSQSWMAVDTTFTGLDGVQFRAYTISPQSNPNFCLDVRNADFNTGQVQLYRCNGTSAQAWLIGNQLVSAGAWHSPGSSYYIGSRGTFTACLGPTRPLTGAVTLQQCGYGSAASVEQRLTVVPTVPLALYSSGFSSFEDDSQNACLNFQSWGSANATLNTQWCQPQQTSVNVLHSYGVMSSAPLPTSTEWFYFQPVIGGSGVKMIPWSSSSTPLTWTGDPYNPIAVFSSSPESGGAIWWLLGSDITHSAVVSMDQPDVIVNHLPDFVYECLGGPTIYHPYGNPIGIAINVVPCDTENGTGLYPTSATSFDISGMWK